MTKRIKLRTLLMGGLVTLLFIGLIFRVYWVQVGPVSAFYAKKAIDTWTTTQDIPQERGMLLDRNGKVLAADAAAYTVAVGPKIIAALEKENPEWRVADRLVSKLHNVLGTPEDKLRKLIGATKNDGTLRAQSEIRPEGWKIDKPVKDRLEVFREELKTLTKKRDVGLYFIEDQKRYYPNGTLAAQLLGYENKDGTAVLGLEKTLNDSLKGSPGQIVFERDKTGTPLPNGKVDTKQAVNGKNVTLTIDRDIQFYMEQALRESYDKYHPISLTAIAADPKTMDILGIVSLPDFDPNQYWKFKDQAVFKNTAIQSAYEPGSTFKIVTLAAAIQEGKFDPNAMYKSGSIHVPGATIHDYNGTGWGQISYLEGLKRSSNVAFVKLGSEQLGPAKLHHYIDAFGFGVKSGIELPGELAGAITFRDNIPSEVATTSFGQGVLVTPIQQVTAVAAVANGGKLMQPHLVKSIADPATGKKEVFEPKMIRQVISAETARLSGQYLEQVVSDQKMGSGRNAFIPGYRIAGKTGTAQKVIDGKYANGNRYVVSFIGYAPVADPKIVLYVLADEPQTSIAGGSTVAAPIFKKIMEQSLHHLGIDPSRPAGASKTASAAQAAPTAAADITAKVPDVTDMTTAQAKSEMKRRSFNVQTLGKGGKVIEQLPKAGTILPTSQQVFLLTDTKPGAAPDMKGFSLRDALEMCALMHVTCTVKGEGYVVSQQMSNSGGVLKVQLTLAPPARGAAGSSNGTGGGTSGVVVPDSPGRGRSSTG